MNAKEILMVQTQTSATPSNKEITKLLVLLVLTETITEMLYYVLWDKMYKLVPLFWWDF